MSQITFNRFELLSNEILLDILEYFDAYTLCVAFYGLNRRLNGLLQSTYLHIVFDKSKKDSQVWDTLASFVDHSRIRSLSFHDDVVVDDRFLPSLDHSLRSLSFHRMKCGSIDQVLQRLPIVNQVKRLHAGSEQFNYNYHDRSLVDLALNEHGHRFTSLVNCSLQVNVYSNEFPLIARVFPHLHCLTLSSCPWTSNFLEFLQEKTPNLRSLSIRPHQSSSNQLWSEKSVLKHVRELDMIYGSSSPNLQLMLSMFPCLRRLHLEYEFSRWCQIIDGTHWQIILEKHCPHLRQWTLDFTGDAVDEQIVKTFTTGEFWSTKKVVAKMVANKSLSRYRQVKTIYFGKPWHF